MKKILTLALSAVLMLSMVACGGSTEKPDAQATEFTSALSVLEAAWGAMPEDQQFAAMGGDAENMVDGAPGAFGLADADVLDNMLGVPADSAALIDEAASLIHMMNANTFTAGAYHVADAANTVDFVSATQENIMGRQWMCGFPDTLIMVQFGDSYVVSAFGNAELIEAFKTQLTTLGGEVLAEESLAE